MKKSEKRFQNCWTFYRRYDECCNNCLAFIYDKLHYDDVKIDYNRNIDVTTINCEENYFMMYCDAIKKIMFDYEHFMNGKKF